MGRPETVLLKHISSMTSWRGTWSRIRIARRSRQVWHFCHNSRNSGHRSNRGSLPLLAIDMTLRSGTMTSPSRSTRRSVRSKPPVTMWKACVCRPCVSRAVSNIQTETQFVSRLHNPDQGLEISTGGLWAPSQHCGSECRERTARSSWHVPSVCRSSVVDTPWENVTSPWTAILAQTAQPEQVQVNGPVAVTGVVDLSAEFLDPTACY